MKPFPDHIRPQGPESTFPKPYWLLMVEIGGKLCCYTDGDGLDLDCAEWGKKPALEPFLESATAPREEIEIAPEPSYRSGNGASFEIRFNESIFSPDLIVEGLPVELSVIGDGADLLNRIVVAAGRTTGVQWGDDNLSLSGSISVRDAVEDGALIPTHRATATAWPAESGEVEAFSSKVLSSIGNVFDGDGKAATDIDFDGNKANNLDDPVDDQDAATKSYVDAQFPVSHDSTTGKTTDDHHPQLHTVASHSDTSATGAQLNTLTDDSVADALHRHSELSGSDGSPNPAIKIDADGNVGIHEDTPLHPVHLELSGDYFLIAEGGSDRIRFGVSSGNGGYIGLYNNAGGLAALIRSYAPSGVQAYFLAGNIGIGTTLPTSKLQVVGLPVYANNAAAAAGGLTAGAFYRTGGDPDQVCVVH